MHYAHFILQYNFIYIQKNGIQLTRPYYNDGTLQNRTLLFGNLLICRMLQIVGLFFVKVPLHRKIQRHG